MRISVESLSDWWFGADSDEERRRELLAQFYSTLRVMSLAAHSLSPEHSVPPAHRVDPDVESKLKDLFADPPSWRGAYEIEQLLSQVMSPAQLDTELKRRMEEARSLGIRHVETLELDPQADDAKKRALYQRLLNDLQWFYSQRIQRREAAKKLGIRVSAMFLSAFTFFFLVVSIQLLATPDTKPNENVDQQQS